MGLEFLLRGGTAEPPPGAGGMPEGFSAGGMPGGFGGFGGMPGGGRSFHFSTSGGPNGFNFSDPNDIFSRFAKSGAAGNASGGMDDDDIFSFLGGGGAGGSPFGNAGGPRRASGRPSPGGPPPRNRTPEVTIVERPLPVTLEDLYSGAHKKMKIKRKTLDPAPRKRTIQDKILEMDLKPGLKAGSKIKFAGVGDQEEGGSQDLHFIVEQKPHPTLRRDGDDIKTTIQIPLKEALTGWSRQVTTIDGRNLNISGSGPTANGFEERFPGLGMPVSKKVGERGDFVVVVEVVMPKSLTAEQKRKLKEIL